MAALTTDSGLAYSTGRVIQPAAATKFTLRRNGISRRRTIAPADACGWTGTFGLTEGHGSSLPVSSDDSEATCQRVPAAFASGPQPRNNTPAQRSFMMLSGSACRCATAAGLLAALIWRLGQWSCESPLPPCRICPTACHCAVAIPVKHRNLEIRDLSLTTTLSPLHGANRARLSSWAPLFTSVRRRHDPSGHVRGAGIPHQVQSARPSVQSFAGPDPPASAGFTNTR